MTTDMVRLPAFGNGGLQGIDIARLTHAGKPHLRVAAEMVLRYLYCDVPGGVNDNLAMMLHQNMQELATYTQVRNALTMAMETSRVTYCECGNPKPDNSDICQKCDAEAYGIIELAALYGEGILEEALKRLEARDEKSDR